MPEANTPSLSPAPLMQLTSGLWAAKTLAVAQELDLFNYFDTHGSANAAQVAKDHNLDQRPAELLLSGCASLGLLTCDGEGYANSPTTAEYLVRGRRHYFGDFVTMLDQRNYPGWMRLSEAVRRNRPTTFDPDEKASHFDPEDRVTLETFWAGMCSLSSYTAQQLGLAYDFGKVTRLLDVGGGGGAFTVELCRQYPNLHATVFDLPFVCDLTAQRIAEAGMTERISCVGGDFFDDALPAGHDAVLLSLILHDWSETENRAILGKCFAALEPGGTVLISELLLDDDQAGPAPAALMGLCMLVETVGGRNYTGTEYTRWLIDAGFVNVRTVRFDGLGANGVVVGTKP